MSTPSGPGAFVLHDGDVVLGRWGVWWAQDMDDSGVLTPTWWKRHRAVTVVHRVLASRGLAQHPATTCMGRMATGVCLAGVSGQPGGLAGGTGHGGAVCRTGAPGFMSSRWGEHSRSPGWGPPCNGCWLWVRVGVPLILWGRETLVIAYNARPAPRLLVKIPV